MNSIEEDEECDATKLICVTGAGKKILIPNCNNMHEEQNSGGNPELLLQLVQMKMPFGKYKGTLLCDLPVSYLEWFARKGFPKSKLGVLLATMLEIKLNGLDDLLKPLKK